MKQTGLAIMMVVFLFSFSCHSAKEESSAEQKEEKAVMDSSAFSTVEIQVEGMTCAGCEEAINNSVQSLAGVAEVVSSHTGKQTVITYDTVKVNIADIKSKISGAGYNPEAHEHTAN